MSFCISPLVCKKCGKPLTMFEGWHCLECEAKIEALEQEPKIDYKAFAEWVAEEIFDDNWEYNKDAFAELACRKLAKLGIVRAKGNEWELVDPQENCDTCKHKEESWDSEHCDGCCGNHSGFEPQESEVSDAHSAESEG